MTSTAPAASGSKKAAVGESVVGLSLMASLTVNDLQKSLAWYRDIVGFTVDEQHEREGKLQAISLRSGDVRVVIGRDDGAKGFDRKKGEAISLMITTKQDVDGLAGAIKARGGVLLAEPTSMPWGARVFRLKDPDGFIWAISSER
jgi:lactoylglutathione lyase